MILPNINAINPPVFKISSPGRLCLIFVLLVHGLLSCQFKTGEEITINKDSIFIYQIPAAPALTIAEKMMYNQACEKWYDSTMKTGNFNGGILVAKNGQIIFERYNGTGHIGQKDTITANTPTHIASVTKTFTAMAILKLVQEDSVKLDDELSRYLPTFNYPGCYHQKPVKPPQRIAKLPVLHG